MHVEMFKLATFNFLALRSCAAFTVVLCSSYTLHLLAAGEDWDSAVLAQMPEWLGSGYPQFEELVYTFLVGGQSQAGTTSTENTASLLKVPVHSPALLFPPQCLHVCSLR